MNSQHTITIGIPAHNEARNIGKLLRTLGTQQLPNSMRLDEIIIISDGSTDDTVSTARSIIASRRGVAARTKVTLIERKERRGLNTTLNEIAARASADVLVLLDADVVPIGNDLITMLVEPFMHDATIGMVGGAVLPMVPRNGFESIVAHGHRIKKDIFERINDGDTIFLCHGRVRALRKAFYEQLVRQYGCPEDAYSYLICKVMGFRFVYIPRAQVKFYSPKTIRDHALQSHRFVTGMHRLGGFFSAQDVRRELRIPFRILFTRMLVHTMRTPAHTLAYGALLCWTIITAPFSRINHIQWTMSETSKS